MSTFRVMVHVFRDLVSRWPACTAMAVLWLIVVVGCVSHGGPLL